MDNNNTKGSLKFLHSSEVSKNTIQQTKTRLYYKLVLTNGVCNIFNSNNFMSIVCLEIMGKLILSQVEVKMGVECYI